MPLFRKKKIKSKTPGIPIKEKIPKEKIEKDHPPVLVEEFNPPPKKTKISTDSHSKQELIPSSDGKIDKKENKK